MRIRKSARYRRLETKALALPGGREAYENGRESLRTECGSKKSSRPSRRPMKRMNPRSRGRSPIAYAADAVRVLNLGRIAFATVSELEDWMNTPHKELGNASPASLLFTAEGTNLVIQELMRIKANVESESKS